ncbi:MAG: hypothetical protein EPO20_03380 [Betaproteobacteria bacterium]|nr:MAG: hypothetical protein EPO20_03380 [Betaproteobacteria bacterium]
MSEEHRVSAEMQSAFVDGQLDAAEWERVAGRIEGDARLREDLCALRTVKDMVQRAYAEPPAWRDRAGREPLRRWIPLAAASAMFSVAGWFGHAWWSDEAQGDPVAGYALRGDWRSLDRNHVLVHVSSGRPEALGTALDEVEDVLRSARTAHRSIEVEIVANSTGLDLLHAGNTPHATRVAAMRAEFPNLKLVACGQTLQRLRENGISVELLPGTEVAPSALDQVVKRLQIGWVYVRA